VSAAVKERVTKRLERAVVIPNAMIAQAAQTASDLTSPKYVAQALAQTLCRKLPEKLKKKGITVKMEEVFRENTLVVLQMQVIHVDPLSLASDWTEMGLSWLLEAIGASNRKIFESDYRKFRCDKSRIAVVFSLVLLNPRCSFSLSICGSTSPKLTY
jgi:hypothetical protein